MGPCAITRRNPSALGFVIGGFKDNVCRHQLVSKDTLFIINIIDKAVKGTGALL